MSIRGHVENGVVVLEPGATLPEGAEVAVAVVSMRGSDQDVLPDTERQRVREIMDRIAALPDENPGDSFGGAHHDRVLYGKT
jgi:hypothetical protein